MEKERNYNLDVIRILATFAVISMHFFLNNGFYEEIVTGKRMYIMILMRNFFLICVPLFIMLTGYLMGKKELNRKYYCGFVKTLCIYVLASIACIMYKKVTGVTDYNLKYALLAILDFTGANYAWYIEMYIGLFLLIPFLNLIFLHLNQKKRKVLIVTLLLLTVVPTLTNIHNFAVENWWRNPLLTADYQKLVPDYWKHLWPITYYYIGCYLREHPIKIQWKVGGILLVLLTMASGSFAYYRSYNDTYQLGEWAGYNSIFTAALTVVVFCGLLQIKCVNTAPGFIKRLLKILSDLTLGAYLVSYIFDSIYYEILNKRIPQASKTLEYYIVLVPLVFVSSMMLSYLLNMIYRLFVWIVRQIKYKKLNILHHNST